MLIPFIKMHAQGNDFVILDGFAKDMGLISKLDLPALAVDVCKRRTEVGADGLVVLSPCRTGDGQMIIFNADGSRAEMCGSALRCVSYLLRSKKKRSDLSIITDSGKKTALISANGVVTVNMGLPQMISEQMEVEGLVGDLVSIGNLHFIVWTDDLEQNQHLTLGSRLENHSAFPKPVNVHFVKQNSPTEISMKIWERGCGATLACGTGATCCVFSGIARGLLEDRVDVNMPGGQVSIKAGSQGYQLAGEVGQPYRGEYNWRI